MSIRRPAPSATQRGNTIRRLVASPLGAFPLVALGFSLLVGAGVLWAGPELERAVRAQIAAQLLVTRDACVAAATAWLGTSQRAARLAMADPSVRASLRECFAPDPPCDIPTLSARLRTHTAALDFGDVVLVDRRGRVRGADGAHAGIQQLPQALTVAAERLTGGQVAVLPAVLDQGRPSLWIGAPVDPDGARLGVLLFELPLASLDAMLHVARAGASGETYAFDAQGRFISQSRFTAQLFTAGLVPGERANTALTLGLRDPGVDLTQGLRAALPRDQQPLTRMARDAIAGGSGVDAVGYRDYRGVSVVGAWSWLPEFGIGVATEVDLAEAFAATATLYRVFGWLLAILLFACASLLIGAVFMGRLRNRALRAQALAERFGQYRIVRKLGEGGMGSVYLADHELLRRPAVIKLVRPDRMTREAISRFEREAQLTSALRHPNSVAVYDYGLTEEGTPYYVMEYLEGVDLERLVKRFGPLPEARVVHLLRQLCGSLAEAHAAQLVHRDIKPANLFLCRRAGAADTLKVLDFGIARSLAPQGLGLTESRTLLGTPEYMAPELFESGANAGPLSDLYAIGCVAYFLLTGDTVFEGESEHEVGTAHLVQEPVPPSQRRGAPLDPELESAVMACLAKRRDARPRGVTQLRLLLDRTRCAAAWTEPLAEAWWTAHGSEIETLQADQAAVERPPTLHRIRPRRST